MTGTADTAALEHEIALRSPRKTAGYAPPRKPGSVRRTSTIDASWPDGRWGDMAFIGRARDIFTPRDGGAPRVCAEDRFEATISRERKILTIETTPRRPTEAQLVGQRGGGHLRHAIEEFLPEERRDGTPLYLILDDISGASLVAGWAWSQWSNDWLHDSDHKFDKAQFAKAMADRADICVGLATGSVAQRLGGNRRQSKGAPTPDLRNPEDPQGWHDYAAQTGVGMRRARRIDVSRSDNGIEIDAAFQDSGTTSEGGRAALHEYTLTATADPATLRITSIAAQPRVLPFPECPGATKTVSWLVDAPLADLRTIVLERLRGTAGCTHLNDALRSLAEVPRLVESLEQP